MPTGYTAIIEDNEECTFEDYLWRCADACLRDSSMPEKFVPEPYYERQLTTERATLADLKALTLAEASVLCSKEHEEAMRSWEEGEKKHAAIAVRYAKMRAKAVAWSPPTPDHAWLRDLMIQQIDESTKYGFSTEDRERWKPKKKTAEEWLKESIEAREKQVEYYEGKWRQECEKCDRNNAWLAALKKSVPMPPPKAPKPPKR